MHQHNTGANVVLGVNLGEAWGQDDVLAAVVPYHTVVSEHMLHLPCTPLHDIVTIWSPLICIVYRHYCQCTTFV